VFKSPILVTMSTKRKFSSAFPLDGLVTSSVASTSPGTLEPYATPYVVRSDCPLTLSFSSREPFSVPAPLPATSSSSSGATGDLTPASSSFLSVVSQSIFTSISSSSTSSVKITLSTVKRKNTSDRFNCTSTPRKFCQNVKCRKCFDKSFASHEKSIYWSSKNEFCPREIPLRTQYSYYFDCFKCPHTFNRAPGDIVYSNSWCPYCCIPTKKLCDDEKCEWCKKRSFASNSMATNWAPTNKISPRQVTLRTNVKYDFVCTACKHTYPCSPDGLRNGIENDRCPFCSHQKLCDDKDCKFCETNSFAAHPKAKFWSSQNELTAREVFPYSKGKYYFDCAECKHTFHIRLKCIHEGIWCSYCGHRKLCEKEDCDFCFKNSFASSIQAANWSKRNSLPARLVFFNSNTFYEFDCLKCKHSFSVQPYTCKRSDKTGGCGYCAHVKLCDTADCKWCYEHSFASVPLSEWWSAKNLVKPREIFRSVTTKYLFDCRDCGSEFGQYPSNITLAGSGCAFCKRKTETLFAKYLSVNFPEEKILREAKFDWCKKHNYLPFDFCIEILRLIIEIDGRQHFEQVGNWTSCKLTLKRDIFKMKQALLNGYSILRISQEDIWRDRFDWKTACKEHIKLHPTPSVFYLAKDLHLYDKHKKKMENK
jgi:very-short-patch-repair endonuclease